MTLLNVSANPMTRTGDWNLRALSSPGLVQILMLVLDAPAVELIGSLKGDRELDSVAGTDTAPVHHR